MESKNTIRNFLRKIPKKVWAILAASVVLVAVCTVVTVFAVRAHRTKQIAAVSTDKSKMTVETVTQSESETETVSETETEPETTKKAPPKVPVGTTKPVEKTSRNRPRRRSNRRWQGIKSF